MLCKVETVTDSTRKEEPRHDAQCLKNVGKLQEAPHPTRPSSEAHLAVLVVRRLLLRSTATGHARITQPLVAANEVKPTEIFSRHEAVRIRHVTHAAG